MIFIVIVHRHVIQLHRICLIEKKGQTNLMVKQKRKPSLIICSAPGVSARYLYTYLVITHRATTKRAHQNPSKATQPTLSPPPHHNPKQLPSTLHTQQTTCTLVVTLRKPNKPTSLSGRQIHQGKPMKQLIYPSQHLLPFVSQNTACYLLACLRGSANPC